MKSLTKKGKQPCAETTAHSRLLMAPPDDRLVGEHGMVSQENLMNE